MSIYQSITTFRGSDSCTSLSPVESNHKLKLTMVCIRSKEWHVAAGRYTKYAAEIQSPPVHGVITIERLAHGGRGVGYLDGLAVFVPRTAPGDEVEVRLVDQRRRYAFADLVALRRASPLRVPPPCPLYDDCGGCHLQHLSYTQQLNLKTAQGSRCLNSNWKITGCFQYYPHSVAPVLLPTATRSSITMTTSARRWA